MKLNELLNLWLNKYAKLTLKQRSYNDYANTIRLHIESILGDYDIQSITPSILQNYILQKLQNGNLITHEPLSSNTVYRIISVLKQSYKLALSLDLVTKNPTNVIKMPPSKEKDIQALTRKEQKVIEDFCLKNNKNNYIGIIICLYTGIRIGELLALTWNDINFNDKYLYITKTVYTLRENKKKNFIIESPKTKKSKRIIPLPNKLIQLLLDYKDNSKSEYIIHTRNNTMVEIRGYQKTFNSILNKCKIKHYNFHSLRHTFATRALELGMDIKTLSEILGHTSVVITLNRYAHSLSEYKIQEMNECSKQYFTDLSISVLNKYKSLEIQAYVKNEFITQTAQEIKRNSVIDSYNASYAPYVDAFITERFIGALLQQAKKKLNYLTLEVCKISELYD